MPYTAARTDIIIGFDTAVFVLVCFDLFLFVTHGFCNNFSCFLFGLNIFFVELFFVGCLVFILYIFVYSNTMNKIIMAVDASVAAIVQASHDATGTQLMETLVK